MVTSEVVSLVLTFVTNNRRFWMSSPLLCETQTVPVEEDRTTKNHANRICPSHL